MKKIILPLSLAVGMAFLFLKARQSPPLVKNAPSFRDYLETRHPLYKKKFRQRAPTSPSINTENLQDRPPAPPTSAPWAQSLATRLQKSQGEATTVHITSEGLVALNMGEGTRHYRRVLIRFSRPQREHSFRALVDPANGDILRKWDRTLHENPLNHGIPLLSIEGE